MGRAHAEALAQQHGRTLDGTTSPAEAPRESPKPQKNIDDPATQHAILHPETVTVKLSYGDIVLHQPSVETQRRIAGFVKKLFSETVSREPNLVESGMLAMRLAAELCFNPNLERILLLTVAKLFGKPGRVSNDQAEAFADEISSQATDDDIAVLFAQLFVLGRINEIGQQGGAHPTRRRRAGRR